MIQTIISELFQLTCQSISLPWSLFTSWKITLVWTFTFISYYLNSYLSYRTHSIKIKKCFSNRLKIEYGVPHSSVLVPSLFNMFHECENSNIENYADDTTPHAGAPDIDAVISELQTTASKLFTRFNSNHMKVNPEKNHLLWSSKTPGKAYFGGTLVESSSTKKLLGIQIDWDLFFDDHVSSICNKVGKKNKCTRPSSLLYIIW